MPRASLVKPAPAAVLNRLLRIISRSLPMYLEDAKPWTDGGQIEAQAALENLVADQHALARRVAQAVLDLGGQPDPGPFPSEFAGVNDTSLEFLLQEVVEGQGRDLAAIRRCADDLADTPQFHALAEEVLGNNQAHLDILKGLGIGD
jgi:hypothetical protein